jgi:nucleoside-diphosphate-sugar epimerase
MKILIIGGTGNISTPLTKMLLDRGEDLVLLKRSPTIPDAFKGVRVAVADRHDLAAFDSKMNELGRFDCVIDMLCFDPAEAESVIRAFRGKTRQVIFCSTTDVYTKTPKAFPLTEEGEIAPRPSFSYAWKKAICERSFWEAHQRGDFAVTVLRPAFTYNESWSPGIHAFGGQSYHLDRIRKGKPIILHGDGSSIWVATYRDDVARAFAAAAGNAVTFGQAYNVSGEEWMTHRHIWQTIARVFDAPDPDFVCIPSGVLGKLAPKESEWCVENFQYDTFFDTTKARRDLGFRYTVQFEDGVRRCREFMERNNLIESCEKYPFYDSIVDAWRKHETALIDTYRHSGVCV